MPPPSRRKPSTGGPPPLAPRAPRKSLPKRLIFTVVAVLLLATIFLFSRSSTVPRPPSHVPSVADITEQAHKAVDQIPRPSIPRLYNPFSDAAHEPPPEQENSSHGETRWYSDLKWLQNPFSSTVTLDENRALLPPLAHRTIIYAYYDATSQKDPAAVEAEHQLLLTWRRAWWAQGFKPIILGHPEAAKHHLFSKVTEMEVEPSLRSDVERWLAWAHMGGGILANWLVLPMAEHDDPTLSYLRAGHFEKLTSYKGLKGGLLVGKKEQIDDMLHDGLVSTGIKKAPNLFEVVYKSLELVPDQQGLAYYDLHTISANYKVIANQLTSQSQASGLKLLHDLINSHLHTTWQSSFPNGIAVLQPYPRETHALVSYAARLAHDLIQCPKSPMADTCPPNKPSCRYCTSYNSKLPLTTPSTFQNKTSVFTIGTVPHPYTFTSLLYKRDVLTASFIRRDTLRDSWLVGATKDLLGDVLSGPQRLPTIKEAIAAPFATAHSIWVTAELVEEMHRDWVFGFELPRNDKTEDWHGITKEVDAAGINHGKDHPTELQLAEEQRRIVRAKDKLSRRAKEKAKESGKEKERKEHGKGEGEVEMVEAWNLADAEVWRFVRAFATRRRVERLAWEEEEQKFAGAETRAKGWGAWLIGD